jgi:hypothetical protein
MIRLRAEDIKPGTTFTQHGPASTFPRTDAIPARAAVVSTRAVPIFGRTQAILIGAEGIFTGTTSIFLSEI